jgi:phosphatidylserine decarboxylase
MSVIASIRRQLVPVHPEGYIFITGFVLGAVILHYIWEPLGWIGAFVTLWCAYFFRDPPRVTPLREGLVVSPADGRIARIGFLTPPAELGLGAAKLPCISIFMNIFDCHINRAPVSGKISKLVYKPGLFLNADLDKASENNERSGIVIETASGPFAVVQIAGLIARRIVCFVREGETIGVGDRIGLIRFGSRVDVYMPEGSHLVVGIGQRATAGETVLADLKSTEPNRSFKAG